MPEKKKLSQIRDAQFANIREAAKSKPQPQKNKTMEEENNIPQDKINLWNNESERVYPYSHPDYKDMETAALQSAYIDGRKDEYLSLMPERDWEGIKQWIESEADDIWNDAAHIIYKSKDKSDKTEENRNLLGQAMKDMSILQQHFTITRRGESIAAFSKGLQLVMGERLDQIYKHGYDVTDPEMAIYYDKGQIINAIMFVLTDEPEWLPSSWGDELWQSINRKRERLKGDQLTIERLKIVGAFAAAQIDYLLSKQQDDAVSDTTGGDSKADAHQQTSSKEPAPTEDWREAFIKWYHFEKKKTVSAVGIIDWIKSHVPKTVAGMPVEFIMWYSGMSQSSIESAFQRWKRERLNSEQGVQVSDTTKPSSVDNAG